MRRALHAVGRRVVRRTIRQRLERKVAPAVTSSRWSRRDQQQHRWSAGMSGGAVLAATAVAAGADSAQKNTKIDPLDVETWPGVETSEAYKSVKQYLISALDLSQGLKSLPERSYLWGEDQNSRYGKIEKALDDAIAQLKCTELGDPRGEIRREREEIAQLNKQIVALREERLLYGTDSGFLGLQYIPWWFRSKRSYDGKINKKKEQVEAKMSAIDRLKAEFAVRAEAMGVILDSAQVDTLLDVVNGGDLMDLISVVISAKQVVRTLETLCDVNDEDLEMATRYYGMYHLMLEAILKTHQATYDKIAKEYEPKLQQLRPKVEAVIAQAQFDLRTRNPSKSDAAIYHKNIRSNQLTIRAIDMYAENLRQQKTMLQGRISSLRGSLAVSRNTMETVQVASSVRNLLNAGEQTLTATLELQLPALRPFENEQLSHEFDALTQKLAEQ